MDSNAKLGPKYIHNDPKPMSKNGELLAAVIDDNDLIVVNGSSLCEGTVTRFRKTINSVEESVLDHLIVCKSFFSLVSKMTIDEAGQYSLTKYTNKRGYAVCSKVSDHRTIIAEINYKVSNKISRNERTEIYDYKNKESVEMFVK